MKKQASYVPLALLLGIAIMGVAIAPYRRTESFTDSEPPPQDGAMPTPPPSAIQDGAMPTPPPSAIQDGAMQPPPSAIQASVMQPPQVGAVPQFGAPQTPSVLINNNSSSFDRDRDRDRHYNDRNRDWTWYNYYDRNRDWTWYNNYYPPCPSKMSTYYLLQQQQQPQLHQQQVQVHQQQDATTEQRLSIVTAVCAVLSLAVLVFVAARITR